MQENYLIITRKDLIITRKDLVTQISHFLQYILYNRGCTVISKDYNCISCSNSIFQTNEHKCSQHYGTASLPECKQLNFYRAIKVALGVCFALKSWKEYLLLFTYLITLGKDVTLPLSNLFVNRIPN